MKFHLFTLFFISFWVQKPLGGHECAPGDASFLPNFLDSDMNCLAAMNYRQVVQHYFRTIFGFVGVGVIATSGIGLCTLYLMIIATKMKILVCVVTIWENRAR